MIDPVNFTNFNRNQHELEETLLFSDFGHMNDLITHTDLIKFLKDNNL